MATPFRSSIDDPHSSKSYYPLPTQPIPYSNDGNPLAFAVNLVLTQFRANAGIKKHGETAETELMREFTELKKLKVNHAMKPTSLTHEQRKSALQAINLIKEKRDCKLKSRNCWDGRPQRSIYDKAQTNSPRVLRSHYFITQH